MGQGFQERINTIVSSIVSSEKEKNKKIDESGLSDGIKKSISNLNDIGKMLVLDDLEREAGQTPSKLLTLDGKLSEEKLREVVDAKINEAEREGIDLRVDAKQTFKDSKTLVTEGIITVSVIDIMIKDFNQLSATERQNLADNWLKMTNPQKFAYRKALGQMLENMAKTITGNPELQEELNGIAQEAQRSDERYKDALNLFNHSSRDEKIKWIEQLLGRKMLPSEQRDGNLEELFSSAYFQHESKLNNDETKLAEQLEKFNGDSNKIKPLVGKVLEAQLMVDYLTKLSPHEKIDLSLEEFRALNTDQKKSFLAKYIDGYMNSREKSKFNIRETDQSERLSGDSEQVRSDINNVIEKRIYVDYLTKIPPHVKRTLPTEEFRVLDTSQQKSFLDQYIEGYTNSEREVKDNKIETDLDTKVLEELKQLPSALSKKYSPEQIQEALNAYRSYIANFSEYDEDTIIQIQELTSSEITANFLEDFNDSKEKGEVSKEAFEILKMMSSLTFDGNITQILTSPEMREQFLQQFDQVIEQGIVQRQDVKLTGELEQVFSNYFQENAVDMVVSDIEAQQEHMPEENEQTTKEEQSEETRQEQADPQTVEDYKKRKEEQAGKEETAEDPSIEQDDSREINPQNLPVEYKKKSIFASIFGRIKNTLSNMKNKIFGKSKNTVENMDTYGQFEEEFTEEDKKIEEQRVYDETKKQQANKGFYTVEGIDPREAVKAFEEGRNQGSTNHINPNIEDQDRVD